VHAHPAPEKHDHVVLDMEGGARVTFNDARRFGAMDLRDRPTRRGALAAGGLGPEPLGNAFTRPSRAALRGNARPVKAALLDQRIVAGLGNIYVCEALFRAGISPRARPADRAPRVSRAGADHPRRAAEAIEAGGSSLRDYRQADGELGYFQHTFRVYGREGEPCRTPGCAGTIRRIVQSGGRASTARPAKDSLNPPRAPVVRTRSDRQQAESSPRPWPMRRSSSRSKTTSPDQAEPPRRAERAEPQLLGELPTALAEADANDKVRCIVLTGSEKAFRRRRRHQGDVGQDLRRRLHLGRLVRPRPKRSALRKPIIAAVRAMRWAAAANWR
jgi:hypothetical protein